MNLAKVSSRRGRVRKGTIFWSNLVSNKRRFWSNLKLQTPDLLLTVKTGLFRAFVLAMTKNTSDQTTIKIHLNFNVKI
jgi:hypothetical protein